MRWWLGVLACSWLASGAFIPFLWMFSTLLQRGDPPDQEAVPVLGLENGPQATLIDVPGGEVGVVVTPKVGTL